VGIDKASSGNHQQIRQWVINNFFHHQHQVANGQFHISKFASGHSTTKAVVRSFDINKFSSGNLQYFFSGQSKFASWRHQHFVSGKRMLIESKGQMDHFATWHVM